jgi:hypothetical protein
MRNDRSMRLLVAAAAVLHCGRGFAQEGGLPDRYPPPQAPTVLIPEAPTVSAADIEVDAFLQIPDARTAFGTTGKGLCVVVIDSGINTGHVSFAGRLIKGRNFSEDGGPGDMRDTGRNNQGAIVPNGHGSNVAGIIAGNQLPGFENIPTGIAHDAKIVPLKVFPGGQFAKINESLQWVLENRERILAEEGALISVVNMSLGIPGQNIKDDAGLSLEMLKQRDLITQLRGKNIAVVVSSGNSYAAANPNRQGMAVPGIFRDTTSVAAVYDSNLPMNVPPLPRTYRDGGTVKQAVAGRLTVFSQRLGEAEGGAFRTDICGPGFFVTSAGPEVGADPTRSRTTQDGTSQAAPTVAGMILLAQQRWRDRKQAADPSTFKKGDLPTVDLIEKTLRDGGSVFQDAEDDIGVAMDNVTGSGAIFHRANALGMLHQIDLATSSASPMAVPNTPLTLRALQAELYDKSPEEQKLVLEQFRSGVGKFGVFKE